MPRDVAFPRPSNRRAAHGNPTDRKLAGILTRASESRQMASFRIEQPNLVAPPPVQHYPASNQVRPHERDGRSDVGA